MSLNQQLLDFLDGSLRADEEAELLHRLSVSPERRQALRGFMRQDLIVQQDLALMKVPYGAEQKLWARLGGLPMPTVATPTGIAALDLSANSAAMSAKALSSIDAVPTDASRSFFRRDLIAASLIMLMLGAVGGYFVSRPAQNSQVITEQHVAIARPSAVTSSSAVTSQQAAANIELSPLNSSPAQIPAAPTRAILTSNIRSRAALNAINQEALSAISLVLIEKAASNYAPPSAETNIAALGPQLGEQSIPMASIMPVTVTRSDVGEERITPQLGSRPLRPIASSFIERFEFGFSESFGRQFPNTAATNVSVPLITNSSVSAYFQISPNSNTFWVGLEGGSANITQKKLFTVRGPDFDPTEAVLVPEFVHTQTNWAGLFLRYRHDLFTRASLYVDAGYGLATAGKLNIADLGIHYDATPEVGFFAGIRGIRMTYDLQIEKDRAKNEGNGSLAVPSGVLTVPASINIELNTGLFFHF